MSRIVCHFSCGAASAVATKLTLVEFGATREVAILNAFIQQEHPDNQRFLQDCERWFGRPVTQVRDGKYGASTVEVFRRKQFIKSRYGAPCTTDLKRKVLEVASRPDDVLVLGYTSEEVDRFEDFKDRYPALQVKVPLIERGLSKEDCKTSLGFAGIALPAMYALGYDNNNCIGCVKGGAGYWRAIREDFPEQFKEMADLELSIGPGAYLLRHRSGLLKGQRFPLHELSAGKARRNEALPSCSVHCEMTAGDIVARPE